MSEQRKLKPISEVLRSPRFQREVSLLLFFFAAVNVIYAVLLFAAGASDETALALAVGNLVQAIIYAVLAILIGRGSVKALLFTGLLFAADVVLTLFGPSWEDARGMIVAHGLLIFVFIRFVRRERRADVRES